MSIVIEGLESSFTEKCVQFLCECLGISKLPSLHIFVDDTIKPSGCCYQNSPSDYMIVLKEQDMGQMMVTLAHELVHVKQYLQNNLAELFTTDIPYMDRWWEQEAYASEAVLIEKLISEISSGKI